MARRREPFMDLINLLGILGGIDIVIVAVAVLLAVRG